MCERGLTIRDGYCLRAADEEDLSDVLKIERESFTDPWPLAVFEKELTNDWSHVEVLMGPDGQMAGHTIYWVVHDELHLLNIAIRPTLRRRGLARALLHYLEDFCRQNGLTYLTLEVRVGNTAAVSLYKSEDYKVIHRRKNYYVENREDALVMAKVLDPVNQT